MADSPPPSGICKSIRITSGRNAKAISTADAPLVASPTTSVSGSELSSVRNPLRKSG
jgi:alcohol dehydrogenase class IV